VAWQTIILIHAIGKGDLMAKPWASDLKVIFGVGNILGHFLLIFGVSLCTDPKNT